jgi:hypothetical protein
VACGVTAAAREKEEGLVVALWHPARGDEGERCGEGERRGEDGSDEAEGTTADAGSTAAVRGGGCGGRGEGQHDGGGGDGGEVEG